MIEAIIVGPGRMGARYARVLNQIFGVKVVAVFGRSAVSTGNLAQELGCPGYRDDHYDKAAENFSSKAKRLVVIATPEWQHLKALQFGLEAQASIIIEKPLLGNFGEFQQVKDRLRSHKSPILPCFTTRFDPRYYQAKVIALEQKQRPVTIHSRRNADYKTASRVFGKIEWPFWIVGHDIDLIRWFCMSEVTSVRASSRDNRKNHEPRDYLHIEIEMASGARGFIESSWLLPPLIGPTSHSEFRVQYEDSLLEITYPPRFSWSDSANYSEGLTDDLQLLAGRFVGNTPNMLNHFIDVIYERTQAVVSLEDAINSLVVCEAIRRSLHSKRTVYMEEIL